MSPDEIVGIFCLIGGAVLCIFGSKYQECTLSFFGSGVGAYIFYLIGTKITFGFATQIVLSVLVSLVFSFICMKLTRLSVLLIAIIHALCISNLMAPGLGSYWGSFVTYACIIILPSLFLYAPDVGVLVSSSFFGSWIFVTGIEQFIGTGFPNPLVVLFHRNWDTMVTLEESAFLECLLVCSIMVTSLLIQIRSITSFRDKLLDELLKVLQENVLNKVNDYKASQVVGDSSNDSKLHDIMIDIEFIEKLREVINDKLGCEIVVQDDSSNNNATNNNTDSSSSSSSNMVTPGGDTDNIPVSSNNDKTAYFVEKLVGKTESSKPLLN